MKELGRPAEVPAAAFNFTSKTWEYSHAHKKVQLNMLKESNNEWMFHTKLRFVYQGAEEATIHATKYLAS